MNDKRNIIRLPFVFVIILVLVIMFIWIVWPRLEKRKPSAEIEVSSPAIGLSCELTVRVRDTETGLRQVKVRLIKDGKHIDLFSKQYPKTSLFRHAEQQSETITLIIEPKKSGVGEGEAVIDVDVSDYSWRNWGKGNRHSFGASIEIDTTAPQIAVLSNHHYLNQGGAGLVLYRLTEPCPRHGVQVGDNFYPGFNAPGNDTSLQLALIAVGHDQDTKTTLLVKAEDRARNSGQQSFTYVIKTQGFKSDTLTISDSFLTQKMPEFSGDLNLPPTAPLIDQFLAVNRDLRFANMQRITELTRVSEPQFYWRSSFLRLPGSAPRAGFADKRAYSYRGTIVDHQVHLGVDLASTAHAPVPASNSGKIVFTGWLGIYGQTIIIDHGYGLFSLYGHLNEIKVAMGHMVQRGETIGLTGISGLAGGDHLHFSMLVHQTFVNPREWFDGHWITDNISTKLDQLNISY